jgi:magnesium chelatase subunit D
VNQPGYPFSALVGHDRLRLALLLCAVRPEIGGVLIRGEKGTAKSTAVRALAGVLTEADPGAKLVELPIGATEDRVVGSLDLQKVLRDGEHAFSPGLLSRAHGGVLYVDEVNLLADHLVDVLLDAAAMGRVHIERDGVSHSHESRFVLVGTMNPEEGELRPQLLDRFGLCVDVRTSTDLAERMEIVRRRDAFEQDSSAFIKDWSKKTAALRKRVVEARARVQTVTLPDAVLAKAVELCMTLGADGLRGELTLMRAARARAALSGETQVSMDTLKSVAPLALRHRLRKDPLDDTDAGIRVERAVSEVFVP